MNFLTSFLFLLPCVSAWWRNAILYEIYIWSFKDSNGDGIGDLKGITQKLDHLEDLKIGAIHITPFFRSPMRDTGYDVSNYTAIDPKFGTMHDFHELVTEARKRDLKIIGDLVINHSSDEHPWFQKSIDKIEPYTDFYVWANPKGYNASGAPLPPNNWMSIFEGSAWQWNEKRRQFYLHQFSVKQPDLNLRNEKLKAMLKDIVKFWFDKGISGFRLDATKYYVEDELLRNEPSKVAKSKKNLPISYHHLDHKYTVDLWQSYEFIHELRSFVDDYNKKNNGPERILIAEVYTNVNLTLAYYGTWNYNITHFPYIFIFVGWSNVVTAHEYDHQIRSWLENIPAGKVPNWMSENHDNIRIANRLGTEYMDIITTTIMTLPGIACIYYGQEIGMENYVVRPDQRKDLNNDGYSGLARDGERLPMQWDDTTNAGFSSNDELWLPLHPNHWTVNVKMQKSKKTSRYRMFKTLAQIRSRNAFKRGDFTSYVLSKWVYSYVRSCIQCETYVIILNLGTEIEFFDLQEAIPNLSSRLQVVTASQNAGYEWGEIITISEFPRRFTIRPASAVVLVDADNIEDQF